MSTQNHLSHSTQRRIELLVRDVTKSLVAGIRAALEDEGRSVLADHEEANRRLHDYVASVKYEPTGYVESLRFNGPFGLAPVGRGTQEGITLDDV